MNKEFEVTKTITTTYNCFVQAIDWEEAEDIACCEDNWKEKNEKERIDVEEV